MSIQNLKRFLAGIISEELSLSKIPFSIEAMSQIKAPEQRIQYCIAAGLKKLGEGSARTVFKLDRNKVLKIAQSQSGTEQNKTESQASNCTTVQHLFAKIHQSSFDFSWLVMELAKPVASEAQLGRMIKMNVPSFRDTLTYWYATNMSTARHSQFEPDNYTQNLKNPYVQSIIKIIKDCDLLPGDFARHSSWGTTSDGRLVMIDYGLSKSIYMKYYY